MIWALWAISTSLEFLGAYLALKRRNWVLFSILLFMAESDVALVPMRILASGWIYGWASTIQLCGRYALLFLLALAICGKLVRAEKSLQARMYAAILTLGAVAGVVRIYSDGLTTLDRFQDAENAANIIIATILCVAWISRSETLSAPWKLTACALIVMIVSDFAITLLSKWLGSAWKLYPLGAIPAYSMWCWAMRKGYPEENESPLQIRGKMFSDLIRDI